MDRGSRKGNHRELPEDMLARCIRLETTVKKLRDEIDANGRQRRRRDKQIDNLKYRCKKLEDCLEELDDENQDLVERLQDAVGD